MKAETPDVPGVCGQDGTPRTDEASQDENQNKKETDN